MMQRNILDQLDQDGLLFRIKGFTYAICPSADTSNQLRFISKSGEDLLTMLFGNSDAADEEISKLFSTKTQDTEKELISKKAILDSDSLKVYSTKYQVPAGQGHTLDIIFYEKSTQIVEYNIEGIQGVCIFKDNDDNSTTGSTITWEDEMRYVQIMLKSSLAYCLATPSTSKLDSVSVINSIVQIFEDTIHFGTPSDCWLSEGKSYFYEKVKFFVSRSLPIFFTFPGFPCKSPNSTYKVLGKLPDKAEELALQNLRDFCIAIEQIYPPGGRIDIISDGVIFSDIFGVEDEDVSEYDKQLKTMVPNIARYINLQDLSFFFSHCQDLSTKRQELLRFSGHTTQYWEDKIQNCDKARKTYTIFKRVAAEEIFHFRALEPSLHKLHKPKNLSHKQMDDTSKAAARFAVLRNDAYSTLVDELMPLHIRFSIHVYNNSGPKFSIKLLNLVSLNEDNEDSGATSINPIQVPWHSVIVESEDGKFSIMRKYKAEKEVGKYKLVYYGPGWPSHYTSKREDCCKLG